MRNLLPLGSIVLLKGTDGTDKKVIIISRVLTDTNGETYDYMGCPWPYGFDPADTDVWLAFKKEDIATVAHRGYSDDEDIKFLDELEKHQKELEVKKANS